MPAGTPGTGYSIQLPGNISFALRQDAQRIYVLSVDPKPAP